MITIGEWPRRSGRTRGNPLHEFPAKIGLDHSGRNPDLSFDKGIACWFTADLVPDGKGMAVVTDKATKQRYQSLSFYAGVFLIAGSMLALQILHTRLLSIMSWYFLAFFAISMAMFGMTAGSLVIYFLDRFFSYAVVHARLVQLSLGFAISTAVSLHIVITSLPYTEYAAPVMAALVWLKLIAALTPPYFFGGMVLALALTRSQFPVGFVYAVDLVGASAGCFAVLGVMCLMDGVSAILAVAAIGGVAAMMFRASTAGEEPDPAGQPAWLTGRAVAVTVTALIGLAAVLNAVIYPNGARITFLKTHVQPLERIEAIYWNSFSQIDVGKSNKGKPYMWGPSPTFDGEAFGDVDQRWMSIDGAAGTGMYRFSGDRRELEFLAFDITNLAYGIRNRGRAAVIGVGGGRDILSAYYFGFDSITGVDYNPVFISNFTNRYAEYNRLASLPAVELVVDEARSWFARTDQTFDLIQMSLIDTWAATGAGAFSLAENGLYTVQGWTHFLGRLKPDGIYTVSRWYSPANPGETGRLIALAKATLFGLGVPDPNQHIFLAASSGSNLATIVVSSAALTPEERTRLREASARLAFNVLVDADQPPSDPVLRSVHDARSTDELIAFSRNAPLDFSPPTDDSPFFFNQLRLRAVPSLVLNPPQGGGVMAGNLVATAVLAIIILISLVAVLLTIVVPTLPAIRTVNTRLAILGTAYFFLIGTGFMFLEIGVMQRLSVFLGHPVYGLAIALAGIILATGIGSAISERIPLNTYGSLSTWTILTSAYIASLPLWFPAVVHVASGVGIVTRGAISLAVIFPAGIALGFAFPTGMRLVNALDPRPTPWFWAVNGAAGVLASGAAVAAGVFISINASLWGASVSYLLIFPISVGLLRMDSADLVPPIEGTSPAA